MSRAAVPSARWRAIARERLAVARMLVLHAEAAVMAANDLQDALQNGGGPEGTVALCHRALRESTRALQVATTDAETVLGLGERP